MKNFEEKSFRGFAGDPALVYCGKRIKNLSHSFGPYERDTFLLYYIKEGSALLTANSEECEIAAPGFFVNFPKSGCSYRTKSGVPWSIQWISVRGTAVEACLAAIGITQSAPYTALQQHYEVGLLFDEMYEHFDKETATSRMLCLSLLYKLFSLIARYKSHGDAESPYIARAYDLIEKRFGDPKFNVHALASELKLNDNYFSVLFKKNTGAPPIRALLRTRMENAAKMLRFTDKTVREIAFLCGFSDEFYFSRSFKGYFGCAPLAYRKREAYLT